MTDLAQLFAADPLSLSKDDISTIIAEMRSKRHQFNLGNMKAGSTKKPTEKQAALLALKDSVGELDL